MALQLVLITLIIIYSKNVQKIILTLCHTRDSDLQDSDSESMGRVTPPGGDLLDDPLDDLLTPGAGTVRTIPLTIYIYIYLFIFYGHRITSWLPLVFL